MLTLAVGQTNRDKDNMGLRNEELADYFDTYSGGHSADGLDIILDVLKHVGGR